MTPQKILREFSLFAHDLVQDQYADVKVLAFPLLATKGINFIRWGELNVSQAKWLEKYFKESLQPVFSPIGLGPMHPLPRVLNKSVNFIVSLTGKDAFGRTSKLFVDKDKFHELFEALKGE